MQPYICFFGIGITIQRGTTIIILKVLRLSLPLDPTPRKNDSVHDNNSTQYDSFDRQLGLDIFWCRNAIFRLLRTCEYAGKKEQRLDLSQPGECSFCFTA